jgi:hypothetical protein
MAAIIKMIFTTESTALTQPSRRSTAAQNVCF